MRDTEQNAMSRRMFMGAVGVAGAALGMAGMAGRTQVGDERRRVDETIGVRASHPTFQRVASFVFVASPR